jgi:integrase
VGKRNQHEPGLVKRGNIWHIDKRYKHAPGGRIRESTEESDFEKAKDFLTDRLKALKDAALFGVRPDHTFREAGTRYLNDNIDKPRMNEVAHHLKLLDPYIGDKPIRLIFDDTLKSFKNDRKKDRKKNKTINSSLELVRRILNLAANDWHDEHGLTWLDKSPKIKLLPLVDEREATPLDPDEVKYLIDSLPPHLADMALFKVNTGLRDQEVCNLTWSMEIKVPQLNTSVFLIPKDLIKNNEDRLVVLNKTAASIINKMRGQNNTYVFSYHGRKIYRMNNTSWKSGRLKAAVKAILNDKDYSFTSINIDVDGMRGNFIVTVTGIMKDGTQKSVSFSIEEYNDMRKHRNLPPASRSKKHDYNTIKNALKREAIRRFIDTYCPTYSNFCRVRVHDLKHTFGRRLRSAKVSIEDRKVLLGHTNGDITTHYSAVEINSLIEAANAVEINEMGKGPALTVLRKRVNHRIQCPQNAHSGP